MTNKLKTPADYEQFSFRIDEASKIELNKSIERILEAQKKNRSPDEKAPKKNSLILEALNLGLKLIEKEQKI